MRTSVLLPDRSFEFIKRLSSSFSAPFSHGQPVEIEPLHSAPLTSMLSAHPPTYPRASTYELGLHLHIYTYTNRRRETEKKTSSVLLLYDVSFLVSFSLTCFRSPRETISRPRTLFYNPPSIRPLSLSRLHRRLLVFFLLLQQSSSFRNPFVCQGMVGCE